jgi:hypothetical protein
MVVNPYASTSLVGRQAELNQVCHVLVDDGDLLIAGVPGTGRRTLVRFAAERVGAKIIEIDFLRVTHSQRFLHLLAEGIVLAFHHPESLAMMQNWSLNQPIVLETMANGQARLVWQPVTDEWPLLQCLLSLPQAIAESLGCRVVIVLKNFAHIRSWDRSAKWETYLRQEIQRQSQVSYALIATAAESWVQNSDIEVVFLGPLKSEDLQPWLIQTAAAYGLQLDAAAQALFLETVQGNFGDAIALVRRLQASDLDSPMIEAHHIYRTTLALVEDLSLTFESLLMLLPASQVRVLESLALDPTDSPHSRDYIRKHHLSRGGGLQGALASLQQKGLVYGADYHYQITRPLLTVWLKHRLA